MQNHTKVAYVGLTVACLLMGETQSAFKFMAAEACDFIKVYWRERRKDVEERRHSRQDGAVIITYRREVISITCLIRRLAISGHNGAMLASEITDLTCLRQT